MTRYATKEAHVTANELTAQIEVLHDGIKGLEMARAPKIRSLLKASHRTMLEATFMLEEEIAILAKKEAK